jgi:hypothetical protein
MKNGKTRGLDDLVGSSISLSMELTAGKRAAAIKSVKTKNPIVLFLVYIPPKYLFYDNI